MKAIALRAEGLVASLALGGIMVLPLAEIFSRKFLGGGIPGSGPIAQNLTLWVGMFGAAIAAREGKLLTLATGEFLPKGRLGDIAHIVSATILFGTGLGIAWFKYRADRSGDLALVAGVSRLAVTADWLFTAPAVVIQFVTGYLLEWSLSVDNIFVIALIFTYLKIPVQYQYRVLFWGIVGAIVLRGLMIAMGTALVHKFDWMFYVFGAILLLSALRMLKEDPAEGDLSNNASVRLVRRFIPVTQELHGSRFFVRLEGRLIATPLAARMSPRQRSPASRALEMSSAFRRRPREPSTHR